MCVSLNHKNKNTKFNRRIIDFQFIYSILGLMSGLVFVFCGLYLSMNGSNEGTTWVSNFLGFNTEMSNATPPIVLFVLGVAIIYITRFKVK